MCFLYSPYEQLEKASNKQISKGNSLAMVSLLLIIKGRSVGADPRFVMSSISGIIRCSH